MSTQTLEQSAAQVTELDAEAVKKVLAPLPPVRAERDYHITIELLEHGGTSHIRWWLDLNYAVGSLDELKLMDGPNVLATVRVPGLQGEWNTNKPFGTGLSASYWAWNYVTGSADWRQLVRTPNT